MFIDYFNYLFDLHIRKCFEYNDLCETKLLVFIRGCQRILSTFDIKVKSDSVNYINVSSA